MKHSKLIQALVLFSILAALFLYMAGFFTSKLPEQRLLKVSDYPAMQTYTLKKEAVLNQREFSGTVVADQHAVLSSRLTARVAEVLVDVGDPVIQGDVLLRLESNDLDARVLQAEQALSSAQAQLNAARKDFKRIKELLGKKLISQSQYDQAEANLNTTSANFKQTQGAVTEAEATFGYSIITAPFDGVISSREINLGDTASVGMQLLTLYNPKTLELAVSISESLIRHAALGSALHYEIPTMGLAGEGAVSKVSPSADSSSRSFLVTIGLSDSNAVFPGSYGKVRVAVNTQWVLSVPAEALYKVGQLDYVKVIDGGEIKTRLVQLGENYQVRKGLVEGDEVVLTPLSLIKN
jgi:RND family efflux transporter MFP subunit